MKLKSHAISIFLYGQKIVCWIMYFYILILKCHGVRMRLNVFGKIINQSIQTIYFLESLIFIAPKVDGNGGIGQQDCSGQCDDWDLWAGWHKLWNGLLKLYLPMVVIRFP